MKYKSKMNEYICFSMKISLFDQYHIIKQMHAKEMKFFRRYIYEDAKSKKFLAPKIFHYKIVNHRLGRTISPDQGYVGGCTTTKFIP